MKAPSWLAVVAIALSVCSAVAQTSPNVSIFATGFNDPRGFKWGPDGNLYVAEAGTGGTASTVGHCLQVPTPLGPWTGGWKPAFPKPPLWIHNCSRPLKLPDVNSLGLVDRGCGQVLSRRSEWNSDNRTTCR